MLAIVVLAGATEVLIPELSWPLLRLVAAGAAAAALRRRRQAPFRTSIVVLVATGAADVALMLGDHDTLLITLVAVPVALYTLVRWASGRQVVVGLLLAAPFAVANVVVDVDADAAGAPMIWVLPPLVAYAVRVRAALLAQRLHQAQVDERRHIARELHDSVAHHISGIAIQAKAARAILASNPDAADDAMSIVEAEASRALDEMRAMVGALRDEGRPSFEPQHGVTDIEHLAGQSTGGPPVDVHVAGDLAGMSPAVDVGLYRIAQESITNAQRHARGATSVNVRVVGTHDCVELVVTDDGLPSSTPAGRQGGYGLAGMAERAGLLNATFDAGPLPERGWRVCAVVPKLGSGRP